MSDVSGGELNFTNHDELKAWLKTQSREVSVVIAARPACVAARIGNSANSPQSPLDRLRVAM